MHAEADCTSMNSWIEKVLNAEDMRRRCEAHGRWMQENPDAVAFSEAWADVNNMLFKILATPEA